MLSHVTPIQNTIEYLEENIVRQPVEGAGAELAALALEGRLRPGRDERVIPLVRARGGGATSQKGDVRGVQRLRRPGR